MKRLREQMKLHEVSIELTNKAKDFMVDKGYDPTMGARPLRRAIQRYIEDPLADFVLRAELVDGATVLVDKAPEEDERDRTLSIVKPEKKPTPVGVGGRKEDEENGEQPVDDGGALDQPAVEPPPAEGE